MSSRLEETPVTLDVQRLKQAALVRRRRLLKQNIPLFIMLIPVIAYYILFKYWPMGGLVIAFKNYNFADGIWHSPWVGLKYFKLLFSSSNTLQIIWNTFWLSLLSLVVGFPVPIVLAVLINEVRKSWFKKWIQTIIYLPHFFSWVIVSGIVLSLFATDYGSINKVFKLFNIEPITFLYESHSWTAIFIGSGVWKEMGFSTIIYLAALTTIDPSLYESACMDGATKWRQIWHITLPGIRHTIILLLILAMGRVMEVGFDQVYNLQNSAVADVSEVISTYIYKIGLGSSQFSLTTAMGLFESVISCSLVLIANRIARKFDQALF
ncbi:putative multiple-sugar transport system permease YteP [Paenibacillus marchantiophytorum]|uniref:Multiple-sugar transport system permease YteP n=1 Tax=Paenibacillus marchantiophytorum TaxID=1619310 RepID=A0ABQ1F7K4_9BACL|nr:putative multiple-sugar transport system permease YteP [Paenibacillus marchantiophytorum]